MIEVLSLHFFVSEQVGVLLEIEVKDFVVQLFICVFSLLQLNTFSDFVVRLDLNNFFFTATQSSERTNNFSMIGF